MRSDPRSRSVAGGSRPRAFTLLEVLVVVAIIALLIAILLPSLDKARHLSRRVACQSNLRQIAAAWHPYLDENNGYFLRIINANANYGGRQGSSSAYRSPKPLNKHLTLPRVTQDAPVFRCPADRGGKVERPTCYDYYGTSYNTSEMLVWNPQILVTPMDPFASLRQKINDRMKKGPGKYALHRSQVTTPPSLLVVAGDFGWVADSKNTTAGNDWHNSPFGHSLSFLDGHAEFLTLRKRCYVTDKYKLVAFADLLRDFEDVQKQEGL